MTIQNIIVESPTKTTSTYLSKILQYFLNKLLSLQFLTYFFKNFIYFFNSLFKLYYCTGGLEVISYTTLFMPLTLFIILLDIISIKFLEKLK